MFPFFHVCVQVFTAALDARRLNEKCSDVLRRQLDTIEAALAHNRAQSHTLRSSGDSGGRSAADPAAAGPLKRRVPGVSYWQPRDGVGPPPNADTANDAFMDRKAELRNVYVNGSVVAWDARERDDLKAAVTESVRYRMKAAVMGRLAQTPQEREAKMTRLRDVGRMTIGPNEIDTAGVDWGFVQRRLKCTRVRRSELDCQIQFMHWDHPRVSQAPWSKEEEKKLLTIDGSESGNGSIGVGAGGKKRDQAGPAALKPAGERNWEAIARQLGTGRTPQQCLRHYQSCLNSALLKQQWSAEEDKVLLDAVAQYGAHDWKKLSLLLPGRTANQLMQRHRNICRPRKTGRWSADEDAVLLAAVATVRKQHNQDLWVEVAKLVPNRTDRQCRERFVRISPTQKLVRTMCYCHSAVCMCEKLFAPPPPTPPPPLLPLVRRV